MAADDGNLTTEELEDANAIGVLLDQVDVAMVTMRALPVSAAPALTAAKLKFFALSVDADNVGLVGVPEIALSANNLQVRLNQGSFDSTWPGIAGVNAPPVVDFALSFPDDSWDPTNPDTDTLPDGYLVQVSTTGPPTAPTPRNGTPST